MKRTIQILSIALAFCLFATEGFSKVSYGTQISLRRPYPVVGGNTGPSRTPANTDFPVDVFYDNFTKIMSFIGDCEDDISYIIYDEEGASVLQGICSFNQEGYYSVSLGALQTGAYTIVVIVNDTDYYGTFNIEEQR